jgi:adenine-specific DNA-methyltransferase
MPELTFKGKEFVYNHHLSVPFRPLVPHPKKSIGRLDLGGNLIVHGDNLHALKALLPMYAGKVDCIYIDPPYNTGNENWNYNDNVNSPIMREWLSSNPVNKEDMLRHDKWLCMMYPRLRLLGELLSPNGTILISIDDNEIHRLRSIMDEIFREEQFIGVISWKTRNVDNRVKTKLSVDHEYVLIYSRGPGLRGRIINRRDFSNPDDDPRGVYVTDPLTGKATAKARPNLHFTMINPKTKQKFPPDPARGWITDEAGYTELLRDHRIWWPEDPKKGKPRKKRFLTETAERMPISTFWGDLKGQSGADEVDKILGGRFFDFPKSVDFMLRVLDLATGPESVVLDSFAGSGTTAHAVLQLNQKDSGNRRFILAEGEDYADKVTAERIRRVINGYSFTGVQREELLREPITFSSLKNAGTILERVAGTENLESHRFDNISKQVKDDQLMVEGVKQVTGRTEGLGGEFTYCTLGEAVDLDKLLRGESLPSFEALGAVLFHTATNEAHNPAHLDERIGYLGESSAYHVWLIYKPDLDFLKSREAALTLSRAEEIAKEKPGKRHLVFAPAKYVSNKILEERKLPVEHAPLPFALYRIERS